MKNSAFTMSLEMSRQKNSGKGKHPCNLNTEKLVEARGDIEFCNEFINYIEIITMFKVFKVEITRQNLTGQYDPKIQCLIDNSKNSLNKDTLTLKSLIVF